MTTPADLARRNRRTAAIAAAVVAGMVGMGFAAVPAYRAFCQVTGWGGVTQRAEAGAREVLDRKVTIRFDSVSGKDLPWRFKPEQPTQTLRLGETGLAFYEAENLADAAVTGRAMFNVSPAKAGQYFNKIECFCFTEQRLEAGQRVSMPVTYFIDPALANDPNLAEVETITLSYTFFRYDEGEGLLAGLN
ncbi:MAG: cytochrome c oxidase assembly protein [Parvularculaceae bacterium]